MECPDLGSLTLAPPSYPKKKAAVSRPLQTAATPGRGLEDSAFRNLPVEVILEIMCHTASGDLKRLIRTGKFMNEIFEVHRRCIFKRVQRYQFPEFLECFGEKPGFDKPVSGESRTVNAILYTKDNVPPGTPHRSVLNLLERYGGWRYLNFLDNAKRQMEESAQRLRRISLEGKLDVTGEQAKVMALCFSRMSGNAREGAGDEAGIHANMSEVERVAEVRMRVENGLKLFRKEPPVLQKLMTRTLKILVLQIARALRLNVLVTRYQRLYLPRDIGSLTMAQIVAGWDDLVSKTVAQTLLERFFFYRVTDLLPLCDLLPQCEGMVLDGIVLEFRRNLQCHLEAVHSGIFPHVNPRILEGSLWAEGLEFPLLNWYVTNRGSID